MGSVVPSGRERFEQCHRFLQIARVEPLARNCVLAANEEIQDPNELSTAISVQYRSAIGLQRAALPLKTSSPSLGDLRAIARSRIFHGLRLRRGETLANFLGAVRGVERRLRVALELRHYLARD